jgi:arylsulfatase A-like enzyme
MNAQSRNKSSTPKKILVAFLHRIATLILTTSPAIISICAVNIGICDDKKSVPNIVIIMADDLGYGDISCNGATEIATPNIDKLAAEGIRFTSGYCSASTCTPTRFSFLTGTYAFRVPRTGVAPPNAPAIIQPGTETIASLLKQAGYATAVIGKWHLGLGTEAPDWNGELKPGPLEIGFDRCLLLPTTNDRVPQVYVDNYKVRNLKPEDPLWVGTKKPSEEHATGVSHRGTLKMDWTHGHNETIHNGIGRIGFYTGGTAARFRDEDLADMWVSESISWIEQHKNKPFFLFFASHDIHVPRMPHERFQGKSKLGYRGDAILEFDWSVGEITKAIDRLGLAENTLIIICSDNGPVLDDGYKDGAVEKLGKHKPAGEYRGGKYSVYEGGTRTPFITRWKGKINPAVSSEIVSTIDLPASCATLAGVKLADNACVDSFDLSPALLGAANATGRTFLLQQDNSGNNFGLRVDNWKLVKRNAPAGKKKGKVEAAGGELYDLSRDAAEQTNVAREHAAELERLNQKLNEILQQPRTRKI